MILNQKCRSTIQSFYFRTLFWKYYLLAMNYENCKISITGDLGSGKSAASKVLTERLGFEYLSTGKIQRAMAKRLGMTTLELNRHADVNPKIDEEIDSVFINLRNDGENYILDSRLAWHFVPNSFKVYLQVDVEIAAQRILKDVSRNSEKYKSEREAILKIVARKQSENERFLKIYNADCGDMDNFDLIIDTGDKTVEEVADLVEESLNHALQLNNSSL